MSKRILIAEDEAPIRIALTKLAKMHGYDVVAVSNGFDLLTVANEHFDVIITDLKMPDVNGASATEIMKLKGIKTPVIALTGLPHQDIGSIQEKFTRIFHKPINVIELFNYVDSLTGENEGCLV